MGEQSSNVVAAAKTNKWIWAAVAVAVIAVLGAGGYFLFFANHHKLILAKPEMAGDMADNLIAVPLTAPPEKDICTQTLSQSLAFGIVPTGATLVSGKPDKSPDVDGRYVCHAQASDGHYALTVDTRCGGKDAKSCFSLFSVTRDDGTALFQRES